MTGSCTGILPLYPPPALVPVGSTLLVVFLAEVRAFERFWQLFAVNIRKIQVGACTVRLDFRIDAKGLGCSILTGTKPNYAAACVDGYHYKGRQAGDSTEDRRARTCRK